MDNTNIINEIRSKTDIVDVISSYLPLTQKEKYFFKIGGFYENRRKKTKRIPTKNG